MKLNKFLLNGSAIASIKKKKKPLKYTFVNNFSTLHIDKFIMVVFVCFFFFFFFAYLCTISINFKNII